MIWLLSFDIWRTPNFRYLLFCKQLLDICFLICLPCFWLLCWLSELRFGQSFKCQKLPKSWIWANLIFSGLPLKARIENTRLGTEGESISRCRRAAEQQIPCGRRRSPLKYALSSNSQCTGTNKALLKNALSCNFQCTQCIALTTKALVVEPALALPPASRQWQ